MAQPGPEPTLPCLFTYLPQSYWLVASPTVYGGPLSGEVGTRTSFYSPRNVRMNTIFSQEPQLATDSPVALPSQRGFPEGSRKSEGGQEHIAYLINEWASRTVGSEGETQAAGPQKLPQSFGEGLLTSCAGSGADGCLPMIKHHLPHFSIPPDPRRTDP